MATPGELVDVLANALGVPSATVVVHDRNLVTGGLRSKGGRGRSAVRVSERDAAHLLTALLASAQVRDSVHSVERYGRTRCIRAISSAEGFRRTGIKELARLAPEHSFIDALEALIVSAITGSLPSDAVIEVAALTPGTTGDIRLTGLGSRPTAHMRYAEPSPWDRKRVPSARECAAWEALLKQRTLADLEQYRRVSARTIFKLGACLTFGKGAN